MSHYSFAHNPIELATWARKCANRLVKMFPQSGTSSMDSMRPVFVYRGMSGIATVTALTMALKGRIPFEMMYIRKEGESTNGHSDFEYSYNRLGLGDSLLVPVFVDDFLSTGKTFGEVMAVFQKESSTELDVSQVLCCLTNSSNSVYATDYDNTKPRTVPVSGSSYTSFTSNFKREPVEQFLAKCHEFSTVFSWDDVVTDDF